MLILTIYILVYDNEGLVLVMITLVPGIILAEDDLFWDDEILVLQEWPV